MSIELIIGVALGYIPCMFFILSNSLHLLIPEFTQLLITLVFAYLYVSPRQLFDMVLIIAHLGGFLMGLLVGTILYPVISVTGRHRLIMWTFRLAAIPVVVILYV